MHEKTRFQEFTECFDSFIVLLLQVLGFFTLAILSALESALQFLPMTGTTHSLFRIKAAEKKIISESCSVVSWISFTNE